MKRFFRRLFWLMAIPTAPFVLLVVHYGDYGHCSWRQDWRDLWIVWREEWDAL